MKRLVPALILIGWPLLEIAMFVAVGSEIGVLATIGLVLLTGIAGAVLLRIQGIGLLRRIQEESRNGRTPAREMVHGAMVVLAGILLLLPGFVTDIVGLLLFIPAIRDIFWSMLRSNIVIVPGFDPGRGQRAGHRAPVIDLDADDFSRQSDDNSPWRKLDKER